MTVCLCCIQTAVRSEYLRHHAIASGNGGVKLENLSRSRLLRHRAFFAVSAQLPLQPV